MTHSGARGTLVADTGCSEAWLPGNCGQFFPPILPSSLAPTSPKMLLLKTRPDNVIVAFSSGFDLPSILNAENCNNYSWVM